MSSLFTHRSFSSGPTAIRTSAVVVTRAPRRTRTEPRPRTEEEEVELQQEERSEIGDLRKKTKKKHRLFTATIRKRSPRNESEKWVIIRSYNVMKGVKKREKFWFFLYKLMKHKNILKWKFVFLVPKLMFFSQCCICSRTFSVWLKKLSIILM